MKRISIQTLFGNAVAFPGDLCPQVGAPRPVGSPAASRVRCGHDEPQDGERPAP